MRHIYDSLSLLPVLAAMESLEGFARSGADAATALRILDVGSGGGLPGIPLAIALPEASVTLLEATGKKARFLEAVAAALGLGNVRVLYGRAEDLGRDREQHRERYDIVASRAVAALPALVEVTVPFARPGGIVLAIKGEKAAEEIVAAKAALHALHAHVLEPIRTPTGTIVPIQKMRATPKLYPRRAGEPERAPIR
jgi:16S rRNA (guanine527-N7)-methyltransferase